MIKLCNEAEIQEAEAREFILEDTRVFVFRWQGELQAYINSCPHAGWPLNFQPNNFFNLDKTLIQCSNHMAMFDPASGQCLSGPCIGENLTRVNILIQDGEVYVKYELEDPQI